MAVTYKRFLRLKLEADSSSSTLEAKVERVSRRVNDEGGLESSTRTMIIGDIESTYVTDDPVKGQSTLAGMRDEALIHELFHRETWM